MVRKGTGEAWEDGEDKEAEDTDGARSLLEGVLGAKDHTGPSGALRGPGPRGERSYSDEREQAGKRPWRAWAPGEGGVSDPHAPLPSGKGGFSWQVAAQPQTPRLSIPRARCGLATIFWPACPASTSFS